MAEPQTRSAAAATVSAAPSNPLQLGQVLYDLNDMTIVGSTIASGVVSAPSYMRFAYAHGAPAETQPVLAVSAASMDGVRDVAATHIVASSKELVFVLADSAIMAYGADGTTGNGFSPVAHIWNVDTTGMEFILDANPNVTLDTQLLIVGTHNAAPSVWTFDVEGANGTLSAPFALPGGIGNVAILGATLVRCQTAARLILVIRDGGVLKAVDYGSDVLAALASGAAFPKTKPTLVAVPDCADGAPISIATGMLIGAADAPQQSNGNQQLAIAFPWTKTDSGYGYCVAVLDFVAKSSIYTLQLVANAKFPIATGGCIPDGDAAGVHYVTGAGNALDNGLQQLAVGYCGTYGSPPVGGCVALALLQYGESGLAASPPFVGGRYDTTSRSWVPFCSLGLSVAIGVFGADSNSVSLGVAVIGCGASFKELGHNIADIASAIVPVDPSNGHLPPLPSSVQPFTLAATVMCQVPASAPRYFALPSDVCGNSIVLGPPSYQEVARAEQIIAYIQAMPFDTAISDGQWPTLTFSTSESKANGYSVLSDQSWTFSEDAGASFNIGPASIHTQVTNTYGENFANMSDTTTSDQLTITSSIQTQDMIVVFGTTYQVWTYPVMQPATQPGSDGALAVIFPASSGAITSFFAANDASYGYRPQSQPGLLISYPTSESALTNFTPGSQIFKVTGLPVQSPNSTTLSYNASKMTATSETVTVFNSLSSSTSAHFNANLFNYVPTSFGLNVAGTQHYSDATTTTTSSTYTQELSLTFMPPNISDSDYTYEIYPYAYFDNVYNCFIVTYRVYLGTENSPWTGYYGKPNVLCMRVYPFSNNLLRASFSRHIDVVAAADGAVTVSATLFNAAKVSATGITCTLYAGGLPDVSSGAPELPEDARELGTVPLDTLAPTARRAVSLRLGASSAIVAGDCVIAVIACQGGPTNLFWNVYPQSDFADLNLDQAAALQIASVA